MQGSSNDLVVDSTKRRIDSESHSRTVIY